MATRSTIAVQHADGTVSQVYCHWDGYLSHNGKLLNDHYNTLEKAEALVALGSISSLSREIGEKHPFDNPHPYNSPAYLDHRAKHEHMTLYYGRDRGEDDTAPEKFWNFEMYRMTAQSEDYNYIFRDGQWYVESNDGYMLLSKAFELEAADHDE